MNSDGSLMVKMGIDTSTVEEELASAKEKMKRMFGDGEMGKLQQAWAQGFGFDFVGGLETSFDAIGKLIKGNEEELKTLKLKYQEVSQQIKETPKYAKDYKTLQNQLKEVGEEIKVCEANMAGLKERNSDMSKAFSSENIRTQMMKLQQQMTAMAIHGEKNTQTFKDLEAQLSKLGTAYTEVQRLRRLGSTGGTNYEGLLSGVQGVMGVFTAYHGVLGLVCDDEQKLMKIQTKMQSLMSILMGLQQLDNTLHSTSTFRLVTVNQLKKIYNDLTFTSIGAKLKETFATQENTTAEMVNAGATKVLTQEKGKETIGRIINTEATKKSTLSNIAHNVSLALTTAGSKAMAVATNIASLAMKGLRVVLNSLPLVIIITGITALVNWIVKLVKESKEATETFKAQQEVMKAGREAYAKNSLEITRYEKKLSKFHGTEEEEKELVDELNGKYGEQMGKYKTIGEWKDTLIAKGSDYIEYMKKEAEVTASLNKYTETYARTLELQAEAHDIAVNKKHKTTLSPEQEREYLSDDKKDEYRKNNNYQQWYADNYLNASQEADRYKHKLGGKNSGTVKDTTDKGNTKTTTSTDTDYKKRLTDAQKAIDDYYEALKAYNKKEEEEMIQRRIDAMAEGEDKEIAQIHLNAAKEAQAWEEELLRIAKLKQDADKAQYLSQKGHTEAGWKKTTAGKKSTEQVAQDLLTDDKGNATDLGNRNAEVLTAIAEKDTRQAQAVHDKYYNNWVQQDGDTEQRLLKAWEDYQTALNKPAPQGVNQNAYIDSVTRQYDKAVSDIRTQDLKDSMPWDEVFGDLNNVATNALNNISGKLREFIVANQDLDPSNIKDVTEALTKIEDEIDNRNPFLAMHKSIKSIATSKDNLVRALQASAQAQRDLSQATTDYNNALAVQREYEEVHAGRDLSKDEEYKRIIEDTSNAQYALSTAKQKSADADKNVQKQQNNVVKSYNKTAQAIGNAQKEIKGLGGKASNLARIFSDDVADGIDKAIGFLDEMTDATMTVIGAIGDMGKDVGEQVQQATEGVVQSTVQASTAGAQAIKTVEKGSVILAVIGAVLQAATAIAGLFNDDDDKQAEIEKLQGRIDELQWELDNAGAMRVSKKGYNLEFIQGIYDEACAQVSGLKILMREYDYNDSYYIRLSKRAKRNMHKKMLEAEEIAVKKLSKAYAQLDYTTTKALGTNKYKDTKDEIENMSKQVVLLQEQIFEESSEKSKHRDDNKIKEYEQKQLELEAQLSEKLSGITEEIIGSSAEDIAKELGDAFFEAVQRGEDAMEAWHSKVNDIIHDIIKRMAIQKLLEEPIGEAFNKFQKTIFDENGNFLGEDKAIEAAQALKEDLNTIGEKAEPALKAITGVTSTDDEQSADRTGSEKGIATASQDSVDENNARLTAIQGHTFTIMNGLEVLNGTATQMLRHVAGIETNTSDTNTKIDDLRKSITRIQSAVEDFRDRGVKTR